MTSKLRLDHRWTRKWIVENNIPATARETRSPPQTTYAAAYSAIDKRSSPDESFRSRAPCLQTLQKPQTAKPGKLNPAAPRRSPPLPSPHRPKRHKLLYPYLHLWRPSRSGSSDFDAPCMHRRAAMAVARAGDRCCASPDVDGEASKRLS
jgi:hypothetical protein